MISGKARTEAILRIIYNVMFFNKVNKAFIHHQIRLKIDSSDTGL